MKNTTIIAKNQQICYSSSSTVLKDLNKKLKDRIAVGITVFLYLTIPDI